MNPDDRANSIAARIADGSAIDWPSVASDNTDPDELATLEELKTIAALATMHRAPAGWAEDATAQQGASWGPLTITSKIGEGRFGQVYLAWDARLQRRVALKLLNVPTPAALASPSHAIEEARLLARVRHPNVLAVYGAECVEDRIGIWTEFIEGRTLEDLLKEHGPMPPADVAAIGLDLCRALGAVHDSGLLHRDIKLQNVMRETGGRIVLMDFGTGHDLEVRPVSAGDMSGTPLYLAPEILAGGAATTASDVYALSVLLFRLLTGEYPVEGNTLDDVRTAHTAARASGARVRPEYLDAAPAALVDVIERGLSTEPTERPRSAAEMAHGLTQGGTRPWWRRHAVAAALAILLMAGTAGWAAWRGLSPAGGPVAFQSRDWVLVARFDNATGDAQFDGTLHHAIGRELSNSTYLSVVPNERIADALRLMSAPETTVVDAPVARQVAIRDGAIRVVVAGRIETIAGGYALTAQLIDPGTGAAFKSFREEAPAGTDVKRAVRTVANRIRRQLGESAGQIQESTRQLQKVTTPSLQASRLYSEAYDAGARGRWTEAVEQVQAALNHDPDFASAHIWLAWSLRNSGRPPDEYLPVAERAFELARHTTDRERLFIHGSYYSLLGDYEQAARAYEALLQLDPEHYWALNNLRRAATQLGKQQEVTSLVLRLADARPNDFVSQAQAAQELTVIRGPSAARPYVERARALVSSVKSTGTGPPTITWVRWLGVDELWRQRRYAEAAIELEVLEADPGERDSDWGLYIRASLHLTLGKNARAAELYARTADPRMRAFGLATAALARQDHRSVAAHLRSYSGDDLAAVSLLVRARAFEDARRLLLRMPKRPDTDWSAAELEIASGGGLRHRERLATGARVIQEIAGVRGFYYAETLAEGLSKAGDTQAAIKVLQPVSLLRDRVYIRSGANGYLWMRSQMRLAQLYRAAGRVTDAQGVEMDLRAALAVADPDHPMLIALKTVTR